MPINEARQLGRATAWVRSVESSIRDSLLAILVGRRCKAKDVVALLEELTRLYPAPTYIRSDNGPEFIAYALKRWCKNSGTSTAYIEPGSPWQNGFAESFNSRFRD